MKALTNYRYWVLAIVASVVFIGIFAVPQDELPLLSWLWVLVSTKAVGFAGLWLAAKLYTRWEKAGKIPELVQFNKEF